MNCTLHPTLHVATVNGLPARIWEGHTENGVPIYLLVTRVAVHVDHDALELQTVLREASAPSPEATSAFPVRMIL